MNINQRETLLKCQSGFYLKYSHQYLEVCWEELVFDSKIGSVKNVTYDESYGETDQES